MINSKYISKTLAIALPLLWLPFSHFTYHSDADASYYILRSLISGCVGASFIYLWKFKPDLYDEEYVNELMDHIFYQRNAWKEMSDLLQLNHELATSNGSFVNAPRDPVPDDKFYTPFWYNYKDDKVFRWEDTCYKQIGKAANEKME